MPEIEARLAAALDRPLPGLDAQLRMAPQPRVGWDPYRVPEGLRDAAGVLLVYPVAHAPHVLLTLRGAALRNHTGQVSLPGGRVDPGESIEEAALREAREEVGLSPSSVRVLGRLTPLHIPVSGYLLHPIVATLNHRPDFQAAEGEVARLLEVPLSLLQDDAVVRRETRDRVIGARSVPIDVPYFTVEGEKVWGATAMILAEFLAILGG